MVEVIFLKEVRGVAKIGEVKKVADGFALNFLLPQNLAELATSDKLKNLEAKCVSLWRQERKRQLLNKKLQQSLNNRLLTLTVKASAAGNLYAGVQAEEIAKIIKKQLGIELLPKQIALDAPLKSLGEYPIKIILDNVTAQLIIKLTPLKQ